MHDQLNAIVKKVQSGNKRAFGMLVDELQQFAFSLAFRILCDEEEAKDAVQESFIKIWKNIGKFDPSRKFTTWMYTIVTRCSLDRLKSIKRKNQIRIEDVVHEIDTLLNGDYSQQIDNFEMGQLIRFLADGLPEKQKLVFILRDLQGLDSLEVRVILDESETFVKSNLYHARQAIKEKLNKITEYERS
jgi:RNA polymerase sigma-70 factor, ECF subfamily